MAVSQKSDWEEWIKFFLRAIAHQSKDAIDNSKLILSLLDKYRKMLREKRSSSYALDLLEEIFLNPFVTVSYAAKRLKTTYPTTKAAVDKLRECGILAEASDKRWDKAYKAQELLKLLEKK